MGARNWLFRRTALWGSAGVTGLIFLGLSTLIGALPPAIISLIVLNAFCNALLLVLALRAMWPKTPLEDYLECIRKKMLIQRVLHEYAENFKAYAVRNRVDETVVADGHDRALQFINGAIRRDTMLEQWLGPFEALIQDENTPPVDRLNGSAELLESAGQEMVSTYVNPKWIGR